MMGAVSSWWFPIFFMFTPKIGEDEPNFDEHIFQRGWFNHQQENSLLLLVQKKTNQKKKQTTIFSRCW